LLWWRVTAEQFLPNARPKIPQETQTKNIFECNFFSFLKIFVILLWYYNLDFREELMSIKSLVFNLEGWRDFCGQTVGSLRDGACGKGREPRERK